ncbi:D-2-hydroxyacid dehydrogenase [Vibrio ordalii]|uniref:D-2-hydroxyacid dehydrogenase n=1 Tax=Vibrio ordalii TaxID=28174 RepID=UPI002576FA05|nr:D-2-hydroxyacid dehydrogenase [Vibrio ordalii]MCS0350768.1 D-2-hydroxyacid dehydrogenase [Vibrio ordalii]
MNNFTHKLYILTEHNDIYRQAIEQAQLSGLAITDDRSEATILLAAPPLAAKYLDDFPQLEWLHSEYAGVDTLMSPQLRQDYELTNVKGIFGQQIAEYVLGNLIAHFRHFACYAQQQAAKQWQTHPYQSINDKTMVILGTGSIGSHLAKVAKAFGLHVIGVNRTGIPAKNGGFDKTYHINELATALAHAEVVVSTLPNTPHTKGLLNQSTLSHCNNALLFNVGRGKNLVESDLIALIEEGHIQHAYLDVFEKEPLSEDHPFWTHPAISLTPHIAAVSFPEQVMEIFTRNYGLCRDGFQLENRIDFEKGY